MRTVIEDFCNLEWIGERTNNGPSNDMSFGVAVFRRSNTEIAKMKQTRLTTLGFGSGAVGIQVEGASSIIWGIHFPLDFKNEGKENLSAKAMEGLVKLMKKRDFKDIYAIGDFNTVPGKMSKAILAEVPQHLELLHWEFPTFYASWYDKVPTTHQGEKWEEWIYFK